jgi:hypothetical protein
MQACIRPRRNLATGLLCALFAVATSAQTPAPSRELPTRAELSALTPGAWTMVVLPDTQYYVDHTRVIPPTPEVLASMIDWIVASRAARNIGIVVHVGDIVDNDTPEEWEMVRAIMRPLDGVLPYVLTTGNHDYPGNARVRTTRLNDYFRAADNPLNDPARGGILAATMEPGRLENAAYRWTAPDGRRLAFLALEWGVRDTAVAWANQIMAGDTLAGHTAVLVTHAYLYHDNTMYDWEAHGRDQSSNPHDYGTAATGDSNDGRQLWLQLVRRHRPFEMVLCGHVSGTWEDRMYYDSGSESGYLRSTGAHGQHVHQILFNAQRRGDAGEGWLRLLEFQPDGRTVVVKTYSPWRDGRRLTAWRSDPDNYFQIELTPLSAQ